MSGRERQEELLSTLHSALDALTVCVGQIRTVIDRVGDLIADADAVPGPDGPPRITCGAGRRAIAGDSRWTQPPGRPWSSRAEALAPPSAGEPVPAGPVHSELRALWERDGDHLRAQGIELSGPVLAPPSGPASSHRVSTHELMAVSELVHLGYSRDEITRRLHARWGDRAAQILRETLT